MTAVFINELHYDNAGTDTDEGVEIAGPMGTNLAGWKIYKYSGADGLVYDLPLLLTGIIPDLSNGFGALFFPVSPLHLQNGAPDGLALVDPSSTVIQFLSYEGTFVAVDGPAMGMLSTDIGVSESFETPVGYSLQLKGIGNVYEDFTWEGPIPKTYTVDPNAGMVNTNQVFKVICVHEDTLVTTMRAGSETFEEVPIKEIVPGDYVKSHDGKHVKVLQNKYCGKAMNFINIKKGSLYKNAKLPHNDLLIRAGHPIFYGNREFDPHNLLRRNKKVTRSSQVAKVRTLVTQYRTFVMMEGIPVCTKEMNVAKQS